MRHQLIIHAAILLSSSASAETQPMSSNPDFEISAACAGSSRCIFERDDVDFIVTVKNVSNTTIKFPLEFIRRGGPYITLHDNRRNYSESVPSGMRDEKLLNDFTLLEAGQSVSVPGSINASRLEEWGGSSADVTAQIRISAPLDGTFTFRLIGETTLRIIGKDVKENP
ncbi:hypothetical protein [Stenotrophomonas sp. S39]|uniref:hypothetical protein n=1 Tax=Stenotrophomonas sp. S39 TaxID=2767451 RepID=UPI00190CB265|nr:hypothetical protein [Stenotrophomonas sp. S39]MBK0053822.1 hypothetical protein [Stenotrophomonas sp. S39]